MSMFKPWKFWGWGTSVKDQAVQDGKEEKEVHGKNDLVKKNMEPFTRMQQNVINIFLLQFILVTYEFTKSLSATPTSIYLIFLSISLIGYSFWFGGFL